jgi:hypothetical protein
LFETTGATVLRLVTVFLTVFLTGFFETADFFVAFTIPLEYALA